MAQIGDNMETHVYKYEDVFQDNPTNPENVLMTIPPKILEARGWKIGDTLRVQTGDKGTIIITKKEEDGASIVIQPQEDNQKT
tara:strand:- start:1057 stop:1305 length:249 start_codon:yes stop_codon:yes gene_type:complete